MPSRKPSADSPRPPNTAADCGSSIFDGGYTVDSPVLLGAALAQAILAFVRGKVGDLRGGASSASLATRSRWTPNVGYHVIEFLAGPPPIRLPRRRQDAQNGGPGSKRP
jgi:hypothetical protein